ncbi:MAG: Gfo/Idh/MocA family protein [Terriglobia bacterium]
MTTASAKIRCGVIGAGWWAAYAHIPSLLEHPDADLIAVQSHRLEDARRVAQDFGIPRAYASVEELLSHERLDAVVVASSPNLHYEYARDALGKGLHVLVEKPMTMTAEEARELVSLADQRGKQLLVSCPWHYTRHGREARELILSGRLGEIRMISALMTNPVDHLIRGTSTQPTHGAQPTHGKPYSEPQAGTYSDPRIAGGGQIYAQVSHAAAYLTFLTGARPAQVFSRFHQDGSQMDIYDALSVELENGCLVSLASTGATPLSRRDYEVRVYGTQGVLFLELWRGCMKYIPFHEGGETAFPDLSPDEIYPDRAPARNLVDCARNAGDNLSPGALGLAAMEVIDAACASARCGENVVIRPVRERLQ